MKKKITKQNKKSVAGAAIKEIDGYIYRYASGERIVTEGLAVEVTTKDNMSYKVEIFDIANDKDETGWKTAFVEVDCLFKVPVNCLYGIVSANYLPEDENIYYQFSKNISKVDADFIYETIFKLYAIGNH